MIESIPRGTRIALDTAVLIYFLQHHEHFGPAAAALLDRIEADELDAVMSTLVLTELLVPLHRDGRSRDASALTRRLEHFRHLHILPVDTAVAGEAARLRALHGFRTPDAIHAASAIVGGAAGLVTNDKRLRQLRPALEVWTFER